MTAAACARPERGQKGVDEQRTAALALKRHPRGSITEVGELVGLSRNTYDTYTREEASLSRSKRIIVEGLPEQ